jgi:hypothetical protein
MKIARSIVPAMTFPAGVLRYYILVQQVVGLADKRLRQLEAQDRCIKPVKIRSAVLGLVDEGIEKLVLASGFVAEDELLFAFLKNQLSLSPHNQLTWDFDENP